MSPAHGTESPAVRLIRGVKFKNKSNMDEILNDISAGVYDNNQLQTLIDACNAKLSAGDNTGEGTSEGPTGSEGE